MVVRRRSRANCCLRRRPWQTGGQAQTSGIGSVTASTSGSIRRRAHRWAQEKYGRKGRAAVVGAVIQLGNCFDLLDESITSILAGSFQVLVESFTVEGRNLPKNRGRESKLRLLDCLVVNDCLGRLAKRGRVYDTVRGAFWEGEPIYPGAGLCREAHIQLVVRNPACILGVFRPNLTV